MTVAASCGRTESNQPDLPGQPERWVNWIALDSDSKLRYVGKTKDILITTLADIKTLNGTRTLSVGDSVGGLAVGAIRCSFHWRDASYGREHYMWRGRWACMAGRNREEIETAVADT